MLNQLLFLKLVFFLERTNVKAKAELYAKQIGVKNNFTKMLTEKECQILLTIKNDDDTSRVEIILDAEAANMLQASINKSFKEAEKHGFKVV